MIDNMCLDGKISYMTAYLGREIGSVKQWAIYLPISITSMFCV